MSSHSAAGRIVVGYDGSAQAEAAAGWAAGEAVRRKVPLTVVHVMDLTPLGLPALDVEGETRVARVASTLIEMSEGARLLVVGTRGSGELAGTLLGSVAFATSAHAHCPVIVVRGDSSRIAGPEHPVVVGVDGSECAAAAAMFAADLAAEAGATLIVAAGYRSPPPVWSGAVPYGLGAADGPEFDTVVREAAATSTDTAARAALARHPDLRVQRREVEGSPAAVLAGCAGGDHPVAILVVGSRGRGGFAGLMLGSVSHALIHVAGCPVAVVHGRVTGPADEGTSAGEVAQPIGN